MEQIKPDSIDMLLKNAEDLMGKANKWENINGNKISLYEAMNLVIALDADDRQREAFFEDDEGEIYRSDRTHFNGVLISEIKSIKIYGYGDWIDISGIGNEGVRAIIDYFEENDKDGVIVSAKKVIGASGLPDNLSPDKRWSAIIDKSTGWATLTPEAPIEGKGIKSIKIPGYDKWIDLVGMSDEDERALLNYLGGATISDPSNVAMGSEIKVDDTTKPTSDDTGKEKKSPCGAKYLPL